MGGVSAGEPAQACPNGQVAAAGTCVAVEEANAKIGMIVREAMAKRDLKAVLAGVAFGDKPLLIEAWGSSMTGVPVTPDMHFRNGSVAIAYIGTVLLQLHDKGVLNLGDKLSKWFPDYPSRSNHAHDAYQRNLGLCGLRRRRRHCPPTLRRSVPGVAARRTHRARSQKADAVRPRHVLVLCAYQLRHSRQ